MVECNIALGKYHDALSTIKIAIKMRPSSSRAFTLLGRVIAKSDTAAAQQEVEDMREREGGGFLSTIVRFCVHCNPIQPSRCHLFSVHPSLTFTLSLSVYGSFQAIRAFKKALRLSPINASAAAELSDLLCAQNMWDEAEQW